jgi:acyl-coenzyme A thioesterase PaaI-like protein
MSRKKFLTNNLKMINLWPPYIGAGIRVKNINEKRTRFEVTTRHTFRNKNLFGTQFGGSLYAMVDPFYAFILVLNLGEDYIVWDKSASIDFVSPGRSKVTAIIEITEDEIEKIKKEVNMIGKNTYHFSANVVDKDLNMVAKVNKELYVRYKKFEKNK